MRLTIVPIRKETADAARQGRMLTAWTSKTVVNPDTTCSERTSVRDTLVVFNIDDFSSAQLQISCLLDNRFDLESRPEYMLAL